MKVEFKKLGPQIAKNKCPFGNLGLCDARVCLENSGQWVASG